MGVKAHGNLSDLYCSCVGFYLYAKIFIVGIVKKDREYIESIKEKICPV